MTENIVAPARAVIWDEDAPAGIEAARRAGMACIALLTTHAHLDHRPAYPSLADVPFALFEASISPQSLYQQTLRSRTSRRSPASEPIITA